MPITRELKNVKKFESVGFTHEQAEVLTESLEDAVTSGYENLKEFINNKLDIKIDGLRNELKQDIKELEVRIAQTEARLMESQRDLMIRFITIVTAIVGIATAIIKLF